ncbi:hypothetical protein D3C87_1561490 [compost metagenome]
MIEALGRTARCPASPAARISVAAEAAMPMHSVPTGARMNCIVSYMASADVTTPPGELI